MSTHTPLDAADLEATIASTVARWNGQARLAETWDGRYLFLAPDGEILLDTRDLQTLADYVGAWDVVITREASEPARRINKASLAKSPRRGRPPDPAVTERRERLIEIVGPIQPATVRQTFYQASVHGIVDKSKKGYGQVQRDLVLLRRGGRLPYDWITDNTRWQRKPSTFGSVEEALETTARLYRKDLWSSANSYVEVWCEKDALAGVIYPITSKYDVPLCVARGYSSITYLNATAEYITELDVPAFIYHLGDYDPSGRDAARAIEKELREGAPKAEIHFERLAVNLEQIKRWNLPTRLTNLKDPRAKKFASDISVDLDAVLPNLLRDLVQEAIERHLPRHQLNILLEAEKSEREVLSGLIGRLRDDDDNDTDEKH